ncbi:hypothetical protein PAE9249_01479 [Paenibacillus sp. CECT 9249]|nr:hypothetical protein PAE9249_01479 [Paenibacillus sp. CECT 9249]
MISGFDGMKWDHDKNNAVNEFKLTAKFRLLRNPNAPCSMIGNDSAFLSTSVALNLLAGMRYHGNITDFRGLIF